MHALVLCKCICKRFLHDILSFQISWKVFRLPKFSYCLGSFQTTWIVSRPPGKFPAARKISSLETFKIFHEISCICLHLDGDGDIFLRTAFYFLLFTFILYIFIGPRYTWGPIYGSGCPSVQDLLLT